MYKSLTEIANNHLFTDTHTVEYTANQTGTTLLTPTSGNRIKIVHIKINTKATTGQVKIYDDLSQEPIAILNAENPGDGEYYMVFHGTKNGTIKVTSTTGNNSVFISIDYTQHVDEGTNLTTSTTTSTTTTSTSTSTSTS